MKIIIFVDKYLLFLQSVYLKMSSGGVTQIKKNVLLRN